MNSYQLWFWTAWLREYVFVPTVCQALREQPVCAHAVAWELSKQLEESPMVERATSKGWRTACELMILLNDGLLTSAIADLITSG